MPYLVADSEDRFSLDEALFILLGTGYLHLTFFFVGFEYQDWIEGNREEMAMEFPQHKAIIERLTDSDNDKH